MQTQNSADDCYVCGMNICPSSLVLLLFGFVLFCFILYFVLFCFVAGTNVVLSIGAGISKTKSCFSKPFSLDSLGIDTISFLLLAGKMEYKGTSDDTPRSLTSPRDDRFYTPRTIARSNSTSNSDEWHSPRHESDFQTPRSYITPRQYYDADRKEYLSSQAGYKESGEYASQAKQFYGGINHDQSHHQPSSSRFATHQRFSNNARRNYIAEEDEYKNNEFDEVCSTAIDENDIEDIFSAARHGRIDEIEMLLDKGVPVDVRDQFGNTILITACQNGNKRVAKAVLRKGADINSRNFKGNTPLHYCYQCKLRDLYRLVFLIFLHQFISYRWIRRITGSVFS